METCNITPEKTSKEIKLATSILNYWRESYEEFQDINMPYIKARLKEIKKTLKEIRKGVFNITEKGENIIINKIWPIPKELLETILLKKDIELTS